MDKTYWEGKAAVVTGAASGIGLALSTALVSRGVRVWMTDIDAARVTQAAQALGPAARAAGLDVSDAAAVRELVGCVAQEAGGLDFLFNNAGIGIAGEVRELGVEHFERIMRINIGGVVNGTMAAYPLMVRQGHGHIVNTASLSGLVPTPLLAPYSMSKHAVVGLTTSLRAEAALHGVRVTALCPAAIETPLLDAANPADLPGSAWRPNVRRYLEQLAGAPCPANQFAEAALRGVERNRELIVYPFRARLVRLLYRLMPGLVSVVGRQALLAELKGRPVAPAV